MNRAGHLRAIIVHLTELIEGLDGADHTCETCGLHVKDNWQEANAKAVLIENRKKFAKMLVSEWVKKEDAPP